MTLDLNKDDVAKYLIRHAHFITSISAPDAGDHNRIISDSNVWAIDSVSAHFGSDAGWATGRVVVPTTRDTGIYIAPTPDHEPSKDRYEVNEANIKGSGLLLVILDLDKVQPRSKMAQTNLPGIAYLDDADYDRMVQALDK